MNRVITGAVSQGPTRWNWSRGEDTVYPQQDGKTPWTFTAAWYW